MTARADDPSPSRVTIYDVAAAAGVSGSTVSRALSRPDRVSFATAEKVRQAADRLGYKRELATRHEPTPGAHRTKNLGIIVADIANPFFLEIVQGAEHAARVGNFQIVVANVHEVAGRSVSAAESIIPHIDGLLLASARLDNSDIAKLARRVPTVVVNRPVPGVPSVLIDNYDGALKATRLLADMGARSLTYIAGPEKSWADATRLRGLFDAVGHPDHDSRPDTRARAVTDPLHHVSIAHFRADSPDTLGGRRAFARWAKSPTDAVVCFNDLVAVGFMQQAQKEGVAVPDDVAVVGFDNTELCTIAQPSLTTVAGPLRTVGRVAAANAMALVTGQRSHMVKPRILPTRVIERESTRRR